MPCRKAWVLILWAAFWPLGGCDERRPRVGYEPPITMADLAGTLPTPENHFQLLTDQRTIDFFPCSLAVAKLTARVDGQGCGVRLMPLHDHEQSWWVEQMRGVAAVRDVQFLRPRSTRPEGQSVADLCGAADKLGAPLLLLYAPNGLGENSAQVLGVLYDTARTQPVATLHSSARFLNHAGREESPNKEHGDHRVRDARYQAQRAFESYTLACLRELTHRDDRPATTQPHQWRQPFFERWWIYNR